MSKENSFGKYVSHEFMKNRTPTSFSVFLDSLWTKHFGKQSLNDIPFSQGHLTYTENQHFFYLAFQHLVQAGKMSSDLFDSNGKLNPQVSPTELQRLVSDKPLQDLSVCTVGGLEGRVMAEMGAQVVNIDPLTNETHPLYLPNLKEVAKPMDIDLSKEYTARFDMLLSSGLIDDESGFSDNLPSNIRNKYCEEFMLCLLNTMKPQAIAVLKGNLVKASIERVDSFITIREIAEISPHQKINNPDTLFVIQKK